MGIRCENVVAVSTGRDPFQDHLDADACAFDARLAAEHGRVGYDSIEVAVQAKAHAGGELERHTFEDTNGREDCKQIYPPQEFPNFLEIAREMPRW